MSESEKEPNKNIQDVFADLPEELQRQVGEFIERHQFNMDLLIIHDLVREVSLMHKLGAKLENIGKVRQTYTVPSELVD